MSTFEDPRFRWRETYFVQFDTVHRPSIQKFKEAVAALGDRFTLENLAADDNGRFESCTLMAPDDFAAIDVCYLEGEEVLEQGFELANELEDTVRSPDGFQRVNHLRMFAGRFDVLHFEQVSDEDGENEPPEMLDPSSLFVILDMLAELTQGIAVDPQSGAFCE
jgi:hypothetical protein